MYKALGVCVLVFGNVVVATADEPKGFDIAKLVGEWKYDAGVRAGEKVPADRLMGVVTFTKDTVTVPAGPEEKFLMAFKIDAKANPASIDLEIKDGPVKEGKAIGRIAINGDKLQLIYVMAEDDKTKRPEKFEATKDNNAFYFTLSRVKKDK